MKRFASILLFLSLLGCSLPSRKDVRAHIDKINYQDGIDSSEAKIIAQHFLTTTPVEPCKSAVQCLNLKKPFVRGGWVESKEEFGDYVGFSWKGLKSLSMPMYVKVNSRTGEATCAGQLVLK